MVRSCRAVAAGPLAGYQAGTGHFWLSNLPSGMPLATLVRLVKLRWRIGHDYRGMKTNRGPGPLRGPHLDRLAPPRDPRLRRTRLLHPATTGPSPKRRSAGLSLYRVVRELQTLIAT